MYASNGAALAHCQPLGSAERSRAGPFLHGAAGAVRGLLHRLLEADQRPPGPPDLGHPEGAHREPRRHGATCARPTRSTCRWSTSTTSRKAATRRAKTCRRWSQAIRFVRRLTAPLIASGLIAEELMPGAAVQSDAAARRLRARHRLGPPRVVLLRRSAHADEGGVLDSDFSRPRRAAACAWSMLRCFRASPASSSPAPSTCSPRRRPT